jgi:peptide chain release factor 1
MNKSLVVSLAIIFFVAITSFEVMANSEINKCIALFADPNLSGKLPADRRQVERISGDAHQLNFAERIAAEAARTGKDTNLSAQLAHKIFEIVLVIQNQYGAKTIDFSDRSEKSKVIAKLLSFYSNTLVHQLQTHESNLVDLNSLQRSLKSELSKSKRDEDQIKELTELVELLKAEQDQLFAEISNGLLDQRRSFYALSSKKGNKAVIELQMPNYQTESNVELLLNAYRKYALSKDWSIDVISMEEVKGKLVSAIISVEGRDALTMFAGETGQHKFKTNSNGGEVNSHANVVVFAPVVAEPAVAEKIRNEIVVKGVHSQGAGGQSVNTTNSAADAVHPPTNIRVKIQTERSYEQNKETAIAHIISKIKDKEEQEAEQAKQQQLKSARENPLLVGSRYVRTINLSENRRAAEDLLNNLDPVLNQNLIQIEIFELTRWLAELNSRPE